MEGIETQAPHAPSNVLPTGKANLFSALALAQDRVKNAAKDGYNPHHKYNYASTESLLSAAKVACEGTGLSVRPKSYRLRKEGDGFVVTRVVSIAHSSGEEDLSEIDWPVVPDKGRPLDKALASALTSSLGYLVRDLFQIPRSEEEDMDHPSRDAGKGAEKANDDEIPMVLAEAQRIAKTILGGKVGLTKESLISDIRNLTNEKAIEDSGKWGVVSLAEAQKILRYLKITEEKALARPQQPAATSAPATPHAPTAATAPGGSTASGAPAAAGPAGGSPLVARERVAKLGAVITQAITKYGTKKGAMVELIRGWGRRAPSLGDIMTDAGKFAGNMTEADFANVIQGFKAWEHEEQHKKAEGGATKSGQDDRAQVSAEKARAEAEKKALADAEKAREEWEAQEAEKGAGIGD